MAKTLSGGGNRRVDFFDISVGSHHEGLAPENNREHSIRDQLIALNVGFMERLPSTTGVPYDAGACPGMFTQGVRRTDGAASR